MKRLLVMTALVALVASPAFAGPFVNDLSTAALLGPGAAGAPRAIPFSTGFEPGEGFAPGYVGGQVGWTTFASSTAEAHIDTANPFAGTQHLRISNDPALGAGSTTGAFSPNQGAQPAGHYILSVEVAIGAAGGADYDVIPQAPSQGFLSARVKFDWLGNIKLLDDIGAGLAWVDTGSDWVAGSYQNLTIDLNATADTIDYYYGGSLIYSGVAGVFAGTSIEQIVLISDNYQLDEHGDFDSLNVTPEPGTLALLGLGLLGLIRRR